MSAAVDPLTVIHGDALSSLRELEDESAQTCVTSPPYYGLRDYGHEWQIGLEKSPIEYVERLVEVFREVRRVLRLDGTCWLNLGDTYAGSGRGGNPPDSEWAGFMGSKDRERAAQPHLHSTAIESGAIGRNWVKPPEGLKCKDLIGIPWMVAFALRADGWYLRTDIIWSKPNPMPESVTDRPTKSHEYIFLLSKSERYYYDAEAIKERATHAGQIVSLGQKSMSRGQAAGAGVTPSGNGIADSYKVVAGRNKRSVWTVTTQPFSEAHFATFPPDLIKPCILAGAPVGGIVLDPFAGSGTTGKVAIELGRKAILIEPKAEYVEMIKRRCQTTIGLPLTL